MNNASKKYYKNIKLFLPIHGKLEKQLFKDIYIRLSELDNDDPDISYEELCTKLGSPQEIAADYLSNADSVYLSKRLRYSHYLRNAIIGFIIMLLVLSGIRIHYLNNSTTIWNISSSLNFILYFLHVYPLYSLVYSSVSKGQIRASCIIKA